MFKNSQIKDFIDEIRNGSYDFRLELEEKPHNTISIIFNNNIYYEMNITFNGTITDFAEELESMVDSFDVDDETLNYIDTYGGGVREVLEDIEEIKDELEIFVSDIQETVMDIYEREEEENKDEDVDY